MMKKITAIIYLCILTVTVSAQYKKASFLNKQGRTHELGTKFSFLPDFKSPALSVAYVASLETERKITVFSEIEVMLPATFAITGEYRSAGSPVTGTIEGKTPTYLITTYGAQFRFVKLENEGVKKIVPYAKLGLTAAFSLGADFNVKAPNGEQLDYLTNPVMPGNNGFNLGGEIGAGATYYFTEKLGIRVGGFYRKLYRITAEVSSYGESLYEPLKDHAGINVSLKYRIFNED
jgi:hypothetical protein